MVCIFFFFFFFLGGGGGGGGSHTWEYALIRQFTGQMLDKHPQSINWGVWH